MGGGGILYAVGWYGVWGAVVYWGAVGAEMVVVKLCDCVPCDMRSNSDERGGDSLLLLLNLWL